MAEMRGCFDLLECLGHDASSRVFAFVSDPADLIRASAVSRSWRQFVITNGFCKELCRRICPETTNLKCTEDMIAKGVIRENDLAENMEMKNHKRDFLVYTYISQHLVSPEAHVSCILRTISASSTDNDPSESILNTLYPRETMGYAASYWSSAGSDDPKAHEYLIYQLICNLCVVSEIKIQPFQAYFHPGEPIYSAKSVRFRMGCFKRRGHFHDLTKLISQPIGIDSYIWTYVSPEFPMLQENVLQSFTLPRPVLCIGGILLVELLGRVQKQESDDKYYICVCHVKVIGHPLSHVLSVNFLDDNGHASVKYFPSARNVALEDTNLHPGTVYCFL